MNIIQGGGFGGSTQGKQEECPPETRRHEAFRLALEWVRSAGQEHCTRVPIENILDAARCIHDYLKEGILPGDTMSADDNSVTDCC